MSKKAHNEAERVVGNAFYMHHPYKRGAAGLSEFCALLGIKDKLGRRFLLKTLVPELDKLVEDQKGCHSCQMKLCYLASLLCQDKLPEHAQRYMALYERETAKHTRGTPRDYRAEVEALLFHDLED